MIKFRKKREKFLQIDLKGKERAFRTLKGTKSTERRKKEVCREIKIKHGNRVLKASLKTWIKRYLVREIFWKMKAKVKNWASRITHWERE